MIFSMFGHNFTACASSIGARASPTKRIQKRGFVAGLVLYDNFDEVHATTGLSGFVSRKILMNSLHFSPD